MFTNDQISKIVTSQLDSLLWSEGEITDENGDFTLESWDNLYDADDATPELVATLTEELESFKDWEICSTDAYVEFAYALKAYRKNFGDSWSGQFGHDLALTRNGHGAGFWDRGLGEAGDVLTEWAESLGELNIFHGHDSIHPEKWEGKFHAE